MLEKLKTILADYSSEMVENITGDTALIADLGLNSLDLIELACAIEDEFEIEIPDRAIQDFKTVGDVVAFLEK